MTSTDTDKWVQAQWQARNLMDALHEADRDMDDAEVERLTAKLTAMGYTVEHTSAGIMVTR
jgi:hypothetical protein